MLVYPLQQHLQQARVSRPIRKPPHRLPSPTSSSRHNGTSNGSSTTHSRQRRRRLLHLHLLQQTTMVSNTNISSRCSLLRRRTPHINLHSRISSNNNTTRLHLSTTNPHRSPDLVRTLRNMAATQQGHHLLPWALRTSPDP